MTEAPKKPLTTARTPWVIDESGVGLALHG
jgi:hypothetical protein